MATRNRRISKKKCTIAGHGLVENLWINSSEIHRDRRKKTKQTVKSIT